MTKRCPKRRRTRFRIGRVSVYDHHGAWWIYYRDGGQQIRRHIGSDRASAERVAADVNAQVTSASPTMFAFAPLSVKELRTKFLEFHDQVLRSSIGTVKRYTSATQHLVDFVDAESVNQNAHEISATRFVSFLRKRKVAPNGHAHTAKRALLDKGILFILEVCRSLYAFAQRQRNMPPYASNPFSDLRLDRIRVEDSKPVFVFDEKLELRFLLEAKDWEFHVHFVLAKTGMRPGELCHLLIDEINIEAGWLSICNKRDLGWSIKTRNERTIPLISEVCSVLRSLIGDRTEGPVFRRPRFVPCSDSFDQPSHSDLAQMLQSRKVAEAKAIGRELNRTEEVKLAAGVWRDAGAFDPDQIRRSFIRVAKRCGLVNATCPKSWRHTFATLLQDANVDPLLRQITLGHKPSGASGSLGMTGVYTHSRPETQAREIERALRTWPRILAFVNERAQEVQNVF